MGQVHWTSTLVAEMGDFCKDMFRVRIAQLDMSAGNDKSTYRATTGQFNI
jgi:hypothetical protein